MDKICKIHKTKYNYICSKCLKPFLIKTNFSSLEEIRKYQIKNAQKVKAKDKKKKIYSVGIIKLKILKDFTHIGIIFYDIIDHKIKNSFFKSFEPIFSKYFPSVLFLNQTEIYLSLINKLNTSPDCYILNSSGQIHPYLYGAACDVGIHLKVPVIGYTKKLLFGQSILDKKKHEIPGIYCKNQLIGYAVPKQNSKKHFYLSVGNNISLQTALDIFLKIEVKIFSRLNNDLNNFIQRI